MVFEVKILIIRGIGENRRRKKVAERDGQKTRK